MPAILEVAIGTFFVFMLFSIVVTALNEVVMTFFDKRSDFLRLGLGELLSDPQASAVNGYLVKTFKFASSRWHWFLAVPLVRYFFNFKAEELYLLPSAGIAVALLVCLGVIRDSAKKVAAGKPEEALIAKLKAGVQEVLKFCKLGFIYDFLFHETKPSETSDTGKTEINVHQIFLHPLIFSHSKGDSDPSYIGSGAFAKAMLDLLVPVVTPNTNAPPTIDSSPLTKSALEQAIPLVKEEKLRNSLAALLRSAQGDVDKFKAAMEDWFNDSMDRVSGWYKLHAQTWLMILGFILAVVCNVDALRIIQTLSTNPNLAKAVSAQAEAFAKTNTAPASKEDIDADRAAKEKKINDAKENLEQVKKDAAPAALVDAKAALDSATANKPEAQKAYDKAKQDALVDALKAVQDAENWDGALADFKKDLDELSKTGIPMGWGEEMRKEFGLFKDPSSPASEAWGPFETNPNKWHWGVLFTALCGWTLTALAASLGAPFWFDLLQRVMNIKANGRAPDEKALGAQKDDDKAAPVAQAPVTGAAAPVSNAQG